MFVHQNSFADWGKLLVLERLSVEGHEAYESAIEKEDLVVVVPGWMGRVSLGTNVTEKQANDQICEYVFPLTGAALPMEHGKFTNQSLYMLILGRFLQLVPHLLERNKEKTKGSRY